MALSKTKILLIFGLALNYAFAIKEHPVRQEIVDKIKSMTNSWTPKDPSQNDLRDIPVEHLHKKLGHLPTSITTGEKINEGIYRFISKLQPSSHHNLKQGNPTNETGNDTTPLPDSFDARKKWPECIHPIRNQKLCGSCWAFASSGFLSDRFCIHSQGDINVVLAPQDLVACNFENFGCSGGQLVDAVDYLLTEGVVSESCMPYQNQDTQCHFNCINKTEKYIKHYCKQGSIKILNQREEIQRELMENGPMMVGLTVYEDFMNYEKGVYEYTTGVAVGGHAIKIIGWGHDEKGYLYWVCQNQWGTDWGENGFINIRAGQIGLDSLVIGCFPDIE